MSGQSRSFLSCKRSAGEFAASGGAGRSALSAEAKGVCGQIVELIAFGDVERT